MEDLETAVDRVAAFLTFVGVTTADLGVSFLAGFAIFFAGVLTAFTELAFTLVAVDWLVFFAGIGAYLLIGIRDLQNKSSKKTESD